MLQYWWIVFILILALTISVIVSARYLASVSVAIKTIKTVF